MSYWRWLLFAAMARFEVGEDEYLRIPKAKTIRRDIAIEIYPSSMRRIGLTRSQD